MSSVLNSISDWLSQPVAGSFLNGWHVLLFAMVVFPFLLLATVFRKQWEKTPGVWKCMILSAIAHLILLVVAYTTQYEIVAGLADATENVPIRLIDADDELPTAEKESAPQVASWDQFTFDQPIPMVDPLERPREEPELVLERQWATSPDLSDGFNVNPLPTTLAAPDLNGHLTKPADLASAPELESLAEMSAPSPEAVPLERSEEGSLTDQAHPLSEPSVVPPQPSEMEPVTPPLELVNPLAALPKAADSEPVDVAPVSPPLQPASPPTSLASFEKQTPRAKIQPRRLGDSQPMPRIYSLRVPEGRLQTVEQQGGSAETERAVELALGYLAAVQSSDGRWSSRLSGGGLEYKVLGHDRQGAGSRADCGITGLAVLAFLSTGNTQFEGPYQATVSKALQFLCDHQDRDGCLAGDAQNFERTYCHSMATLALSEALAVTGDPRLTPIVRRAVEYSARTQSRIDGGWRYQPGDSGDMSQFGWKVLALHSASLGGIEIPQETLSGMHKFLEHCTRGQHKGLGCYRPGDAHTPTMTAEALSCRFLLKEEIDRETIDEAMTFVLQNLPSEQEINYYYWYYATMAAHHAGGHYWETWNRHLKPVLLNHQVRTGAEAGAWPADGLWSGYGGKVYSTAMATLCLEAYYRYVSIESLRK